MLPPKTIKGMGVSILKFLRFALRVGDGSGEVGGELAGICCIAQGAQLGARG